MTRSFCLFAMGTLAAIFAQPGQVDAEVRGSTFRIAAVGTFGFANGTASFATTGNFNWIVGDTSYVGTFQETGNFLASEWNGGSSGGEADGVCWLSAIVVGRTYRDSPNQFGYYIGFRTGPSPYFRTE